MSNEASLEIMINIALPDLREIVWHSDGKITAKTGANALNPKKLYGGGSAIDALAKLIKDREATDSNNSNKEK